MGGRIAGMGDHVPVEAERDWDLDEVAVAVTGVKAVACGAEIVQVVEVDMGASRKEDRIRNGEVPNIFLRWEVQWDQIRPVAEEDMSCTEDSMGMAPCTGWEVDQGACMGSGIVMNDGILVVEDVVLDRMQGLGAAHKCWHM